MFVILTWDMGDEDLEPWLEWRNCLSWEDDGGKPPTYTQTIGQRTWKKRTHTKVKATFLQAFDLHAYPFDAHKLEIVLVSNPISDIVISKAVNQKDAATLHKYAMNTLTNSSW